MAEQGYVLESPVGEICQGDIFSSLEVWWTGDVDRTEAEARVLQEAILLTHSCEFDRNRSTLIVAEVAPITELPMGGVLGHLRANRVKHMFLLPAGPADRGESIVMLRTMTTVRRSTLVAAAERRVARVSGDLLQALHRKIGLFFGLDRDPPDLSPPAAQAPAPG